MRNLLLTVVATLAINGAVAQKQSSKHKSHQAHHQGTTAEQQAKQQAEKMEKLLTLTADQKQKIYDASLRKSNKIKAAKEQYKDDANKKGKLGPEIKAAKKTYTDEVNAILSVEQQTKWKAHKEDMKQKHQAKKARINQQNAPGLKQPDDNVEDEQEAEDSEE